MHRLPSGTACLLLLLGGCHSAPEPDGGLVDASAVDASADAGSEDAASEDAGQEDASQVPGPDASTRGAHADVVAVSPSGADGAYTFTVSVESSDIGCDRYADWWEVLDPDGQLIYRRTLGHSHTDDNGTTDADAPGNTFTRSGGPVAVTAEQTVIVRAHLHPVGYVGRAMRGSVGGGFLRYELPPGFAEELREAAPQPPSCAF